MSVGANAIAQMAIGADPEAASKSKSAPKRTVTAKADAAMQPERR